MGRGGAVATPGVAWDVHVRPRSRAGFSAPEPAVDAAAAGFSGGDGRKSHVYRGSCLPKGSAAAQTRQRPAKKLNPLPSRTTAGSGVARVMSAPLLRPVTASAPCSMLATMNLPLDTTSELSAPRPQPPPHTTWLTLFVVPVARHQSARLRLPIHGRLRGLRGPEPPRGKRPRAAAQAPASSALVGRRPVGDAGAPQK